MKDDITSNEYGLMDDFNSFSEDIAKGLGLNEYYEYCYKNGSEHVLYSENDFYELNPSLYPKQKNYGRYGIAMYTKNGVPTHFMLLRRETQDKINPSYHDDYTFVETRFVFSQKIGRR